MTKRTVYLAKADYAGYVVTAVGSTAANAQAAVEAAIQGSINRPGSGAWDPRPAGWTESLWEYLSGWVVPMEVDGKVEWL